MFNIYGYKLILPFVYRHIAIYIYYSGLTNLLFPHCHCLFICCFFYFSNYKWVHLGTARQLSLVTALCNGTPCESYSSRCMFCYLLIAMILFVFHYYSSFFLSSPCGPRLVDSNPRLPRVQSSICPCSGPMEWRHAPPPPITLRRLLTQKSYPQSVEWNTWAQSRKWLYRASYSPCWVSIWSKNCSLAVDNSNIRENYVSPIGYLYMGPLCGMKYSSSRPKITI